MASRTHDLNDDEALADPVVLLGLRSPLVLTATVVLAIGYALAIIGTAEHMTPAGWGTQGAALTLQLLCIYTAVAIPADPLPRWAALVISLASFGALAIAWIYAPPTDEWFVQVTAPPAMTSVVVGVLAVRGRAGVAWLITIIAMASAIVWCIAHDFPASMGVAMTRHIVSIAVPATVLAWMLRPMLGKVGALRQQQLAAVEREAERAATLRERVDRLRVYEDEVDPILRRIASGGEFTEEEALYARLIEHTLRDEVRGRGWDSAGVRVGAATARARGVVVQLFDDGGLDVSELGAADVERLRGELVLVLATAESGSVTARILPAGRECLAVITVVDGSRVERRLASLTVSGLQWVADDPALA